MEPKVQSELKLTERVNNKDRVFGANRNYFPCYVEREDGTVVPALFTRSAIEAAVLRATKNPEDVPEKASWLDNIFG